MAPRRSSTDDALEHVAPARRTICGKPVFSESFADCVGLDIRLVNEPLASDKFVSITSEGRGLSFKSDDYGLWDEGDLDETTDAEEMVGDSTHSLHSTSSVSSLTSIRTSSSESSLKLNAAVDDSLEVGQGAGVNPVFVFENGRAPVCCRAFESVVSSRIVQVSISLPGFRIVQSNTGEYAEFRVKMLLNGKEMAIWKKFSYFEQLAEACREYSSVEVAQSWTSMFKSASSPSPSTRKCRVSGTKNKNKVDFSDTLVAWERVLVARFWGWTLSHTISVQRLMEESQLLEIFLKCILFEVPSPEILVEFFSQSS